ncbi:FecR family protein [Marinilabilia sp.]|uniref:FecR family protein n=1 Tax=Marinilabilia sp. TaxID=2021252 RepID=UPI0025BF456C|nr:FecR domain-containing protein [Marinilabilia sp.]
MNKKKDISRIIGRNLMVAASEDEKNVLRKWRSSSEQNEQGYQVLKRLFQHRYYNENSTEEEVPVESFFTRARLLQSQTRTLNWWKIAAAIAVLISLGSLVSDFLYVFDSTRVELVADSGQRTEAVLPDGSNVWLNNSTRLVYEHRFGRKRSIQLEGEAYFEVEKDVSSPFLVETGGLEVKVTGTRFNVKNYSTDHTVEVALSEGSVNVKSSEGERVQMKPGEVLLLDKRTLKMIKKNGQVKDNFAWRDGVMVFKDEAFENLITRLERWYDIKIDYEPGDFKGIHYSGTIRNLRLDQVFEFVNLTVPIEVEMKSNHIVLHKEKKSNEKSKAMN